MQLGNRILYNETLNSILIPAWHNTEMDPATVSVSMRLHWRDGLWLSVAVLLHALLLLVPMRHSAPAAQVSQVVSVTLLAPRKEQAVFADERLPFTQDIAPAQKPPLAEVPTPPGPIAMESSPEEPVVVTTTALLLDSASRFKWPSIEQDEIRQLGVFVPQPTPENWRPRGVGEDNLFNGMILPTRTEIVDRWLAADGNHNVVLNTPSGETLCGRAKSWDPMNPELEPIMAFWKCGGGGKRDFKMPERFMRSRQ